MLLASLRRLLLSALSFLEVRSRRLLPYALVFTATVLLIVAGLPPLAAAGAVCALLAGSMLWGAFRLRLSERRHRVPVLAPPSRQVASLECPSGSLVVADLLALRHWSGLRPPRPDTAELVDSVLRASMNASRDLVLDPPDPALGRRLGMGPLPYLYDVPAHELEDRLEVVRSRARRLGSPATLRMEPVRTPHLVRARRAAAAPGGLGASFPLEGLVSHALPAEGVSVELGAGASGSVVSLRTSAAVPASASVVADLSTPSRMVVLGDAGTLSSWSGTRSRDGLADLLAWGEGAKGAATAFGGTLADDGGVVWLGLPEVDAAALAEEVDAWALRSGELLAWDLRPHSDEYFLLEQVELDGVGVLSFPEGDVVGLLVDHSSTRLAALWDAEGAPVSFRLLPPSA